MKRTVAVVGATGLVGRTMLKVLEERRFPLDKLVLFASEASAGKTLPFCGEQVEVIELNDKNIEASGADIALFSAGAEVSGRFAPVFARCGGVVIDNSSRFRMDEAVPLVVPEVNPQAIGNSAIIANPNCSTIQAVVALKPLADAFGLRRVVYTTYQAVSGAGRRGLDDLDAGIEGEAPKKFPHPIAFNILPHIDVFEADGYTKEEHKMINETRKILGDKDLRVTATTVRVPVRFGHCESINAQFIRPVSRESALEALAAAPGVTVVDDPAANLYPMPLDAEGKDGVFVGRVRVDGSAENSLNMWVVADNIRKGAATNAVQIAELIIRDKKR